MTPARTGAFIGMLQEGMVHILIGYDQILFIIGMLLGVSAATRRGPRPEDEPNKRLLPQLITLISAFTLGHSATLALQALDIVTPPGPWIEPMIAASVVIAALGNLLGDAGPRVRLGLVFAFGLIHGFGFAGVLEEIGLSGGPLLVSLIGFNLGVEAGQLAIVATFMLLVSRIRHTGLFHRLVHQGASMVIAGIGVWWLIERIQ